jgi:hypothetical protein
MPEQPVFENARLEVEKQLNAYDFMEKHAAEIFNRLKDAEARAESMGPEGNLFFVAECLPFVAAIVHVGSKPEDFRKARDWAQKKLPNADAVSALSALTFLNIVENGITSATIANAGDLPVWQSMRKRLDSLLPASGNLGRSGSPSA